MFDRLSNELAEDRVTESCHDIKSHIYCFLIPPGVCEKFPPLRRALSFLNKRLDHRTPACPSPSFIRISRKLRVANVISGLLPRSTFSGNGYRAEITATQSAPASITSGARA